MTSARYLVGPALDVVRSLEPRSVQSVITSPPYWRKRAYLPDDHPDKAAEWGQEDSPGEFLAHLLELTDALWDTIADDGTIWFNLGDTAAGSGGAGGDYNDGGLRGGQNRYVGTARAVNGKVDDYRPVRKSGPDHPLPKSVCWIPDLFGASLAYGRNLLTGEPCRQWITRPPVTWCKPNPTPGEIIDKFREATELFVWASKQPRYYFDLDALRHYNPRALEESRTRAQMNRSAPGYHTGEDDAPAAQNLEGAPPLNWWVVTTSSYAEAHFATFPPELIRMPVIASCPLGGTILDPFGGSGTTAMVATGNGRDCICIDIDARDAELALERVGPLLLSIEHAGT